jgi:hypothetical protein
MTPRQTHPLTVAAALALVLAAVYLLTLTAKPIVSDETEYADAADSLYHFGVPWRDLTAWERFPTRLPDASAVPLRVSMVDSGFLWAALPWVALAERIDGIGTWHVLMSVNALVTPLVGLAAFAWAYRLTGSRFAAGAVMLSVGLLTGFWPYAHTFFREPLHSALLLSGALLCWSGGRRGTLLGLAVLIGAFMVKDTLLFAMPGLAVLLLPRGWWDRVMVRRAALGLLASVMALTLALIYTPLLTWLGPLFPNGYLFSPAFPLLPDTTRVALHSYLLAAGGAFWATAPILLLAVPGALMLWRRGEARTVTACVLVLLGTALGYAVLRGEGDIGGNWFGGTMWPHRFLLPAIPFIAVLSAPIWDILGKRGNLFLAICVAFLGIYSLVWAGLGALFPWDLYGYLTSEQSGGLSYWLPGLNVLALSRPAVYLPLIGQFPSDVAWVRAGLDGFAWGFAALGLAGIGWVVLAARSRHQTRVLLGISASFGVLLALMFGGWQALYVTDPYTHGAREDLHALAALMRERVPEGGVVVLNQPDTVRFWANAGKPARRWLVGLPYPPGEVGQPDDPRPSEAALAAPASLLADGVAPWVEHVAARHSRLWVLMDRSIDVPWTIRPLERFLAERYYLVRDDKLSAFARLLEYDTTPAPTTSPHTPPLPIGVTFSDPQRGERITLHGASLPQVSANGVLTVSLAWQVEQTLTQDVTVAVFAVSTRDAYVRAQGIDSWLGGTFKTSTLIPAGGAVWDQRAIRLEGLPDGTYQVWVKVYTIGADGAPLAWHPDADPTGEQAAVLSATVDYGGAARP